MLSSKENFTKKVADIQKMLKAPKSQYNEFGKYAYRSTEDILEAIKPLLNGLVLTIQDEIISAGDRVYVKATAKLSDGIESLESSSFAREPLEKKGMDSSQITGATSSYARKYALNGLFLIDDTKDADNTNTHGKEDKKQVESKVETIKLASDINEVPKQSEEKKENKPAPSNSFRRQKANQGDKNDGI